jgi:hypothetical protein
MGRLLASLPAGERVRRYREIAAEAFRHAAEVENADLRAEYLSLASAWQGLAIQIAHMTGLARPTGLDGSHSTEDPSDRGYED